MIRQAISCDICASEKKQTNHWFVAYEIAGELRVSGWNSRNRQKPNAKHLCGQTCLHKLVDDFMARTIVRNPAAIDVSELDLEPESAEPNLAPAAAPPVATAVASNRRAAASAPAATPPPCPAATYVPRNDTSLTAQPTTSGYEDEYGSSARLIAAPAAPAAAATPQTPPAAQAPAAVAAKVPARASAELVRMPGRGHNEDRPAAQSESPRYSSRNWRSEAWERERERELRAAARLRSNG